MPYQYTSRVEGEVRRATIAAALDAPEVEVFTVTPTDRDGKSDYDAAFDVLAVTVEEAARIATKRLYGDGVHARRTTGDPRKSGLFQSYEPARGNPGAYTSVGRSFHVG